MKEILKSVKNVAWNNTNQYVVVGDMGIITTIQDGIGHVVTVGDSYLNNVIYENDQYIAIGDGGFITTSPDGKIWTNRNSGVNDVLNDIIYANNQYIIVGNRGTILTSPDSITWTKRDSKTTNNLTRISSFTNNYYNILGDNNTVLTSRDGYDWVNVTLFLFGERKKRKEDIDYVQLEDQIKYIIDDILNFDMDDLSNDEAVYSVFELIIDTVGDILRPLEDVEHKKELEYGIEFGPMYEKWDNGIKSIIGEITSFDFDNISDTEAAHSLMKTFNAITKDIIEVIEEIIASLKHDNPKEEIDQLYENDPNMITVENEEVINTLEYVANTTNFDTDKIDNNSLDLKDKNNPTKLVETYNQSMELLGELKKKNINYIDYKNQLELKKELNQIYGIGSNSYVDTDSVFSDKVNKGLVPKFNNEDISALYNIDIVSDNIKCMAKDLANFEDSKIENNDFCKNIASGIVYIKSPLGKLRGEFRRKKRISFQEKRKRKPYKRY